MHFWPPMFAVVAILAHLEKKCNFKPLIFATMLRSRRVSQKRGQNHNFFIKIMGQKTLFP